jgi:hypothetical protein
MNKQTRNRTILAFWLIATCLQACAGVRPDAKDVETNSKNTRECLLLAQIHTTTAVSNQEILFRLYGGEHWRNKLPVGCTGLGFNRGFTYDTSLHRLCRGQFIQTLEPRRSPCVLGLFHRDTGKTAPTGSAGSRPDQRTDLDNPEADGNPKP